MSDRVTYYEKKGKRYIPVLEKNVWNGGDLYNEGCHLVVCKPGVRSTRYNIEPDDSAFLAAQMIYAEDLAKMIMEESAAKISPAPLTPEQKEAWDALQKAFDGGPFYINYESSLGIARNFLLKLKEKFDCLD